MDYRTITTEFEYYEPYLPCKRHKLPRLRKQKESIALHLPSLPGAIRTRLKAAATALLLRDPP